MDSEGGRTDLSEWPCLKINNLHCAIQTRRILRPILFADVLRARARGVVRNSKIAVRWIGLDIRRRVRCNWAIPQFPHEPEIIQIAVGRRSGG